MDTASGGIDWSDLNISVRDDACETLVLLVREGAPLGELESRSLIDRVTNDTRIVLCVPFAWVRRVDRAARGGAFERMTPDAVAHRILTTPEAA